MSANDNVVSIKSRKPIEVEKELEDQAAAESKAREIEVNLKWFDQIREQIAAGAFVMPMVFAYSPATGLFFTDFVAPDGGVPYGLAHSYVAQLELMKLAMTEIAVMGPMLQVDGSLVQHAEEDE